MSSSIRETMMDDWFVPAVAAAVGIVGVVRERPTDYAALPAVPSAQGRAGHPFCWCYLNPDVPVDTEPVVFLSADVVAPVGVTVECVFRIENQWTDSDIESKAETYIAAIHRAVMDDVQNNAANLPAGVINVNLAAEPTVDPAPTDGLAVATLHFQVDIQRSYFDLNQTRAA